MLKIKKKSHAVPTVTTTSATKKSDTPKAQTDTDKKRTRIEDRYTPEFEPLEVFMTDKYKLILTVQRDNDGGLLELDIRVFQTTDVYSGFTRKGIRIPLERLSDVETAVYNVIEKCERAGLMEEAYSYDECEARQFADSQE